MTTANVIRKEESNYGNFLADLGRLFYNTDLCIINSGSIRSDTVLNPHKINFLFVDGLIDGPLTVLKIPGKTVVEMLEHSVSVTPETAGLFLCVSGMKYTYDHTKNPKVQSVQIDGKLLELDKMYTLTVPQYVAGGGDGYSCLS